MIKSPCIFLSAFLALILFQSCEGPAGNRPLPLGNKYPFGMVELYGDTLLAMQLGSQVNTIINPSGAAVPLDDNGLLYLVKDEEAHFLWYKKEDGQRLDLELRPGQLWVNGRLHAVALDSSAESGTWLSKYSPEDLAGLRTVTIGQGIPEAWFPRIFGLIKINPSISFLTENLSELPERDLILMQGLWKATVPELFLGNDKQVVYANLRAAKAIYLEQADSLPARGYLQFLAKMPSGGKIWLDGFSESEISKILATTKPDELALENSEIRNAQTLAAWTGLKSLFLNMHVRDFGILRQLQTLERLGVAADAASVGFESVRGLRFLCLEADSAVALAILAQNPDVQFLCLKSENLHKFPDFSKFKELKGLVLPAVASQDYSAVGAWKVPYIGAPVTDSVLQVIRQKAPEAMVYGQGRNFWGACLGSGWLGLLLPLFFVLVYRNYLAGQCPEK